ncbi:hypothetical protein [Priestia megaterium]|uniref:hypothetical protein n=1 Tax=Priestia megaterium TaxID=1404 RepID=UPI0027A96434|nr:hypothetical protein [Priestia megaterium]WDC90826.1 hypothetical protein PSR56_12540 [Priestia megaterium]
MNRIKSKLFLLLMFALLPLAACSSDDAVIKENTETKKSEQKKVIKIKEKDNFDLPPGEHNYKLLEKEYFQLAEGKNGFDDSMIPKDASEQDKAFLQFVKAVNLKDEELFPTLFDTEAQGVMSTFSRIYVEEGNENEYIDVTSIERFKKPFIDEDPSEWVGYKYTMRDFEPPTEGFEEQGGDVHDFNEYILLHLEDGEWKIFNIYDTEELEYFSDDEDEY